MFPDKASFPNLALARKSVPAGFLLSSCSSNGGKTTATVGLLLALQKRAIKVLAAKAGPDYIDTAWLGRVSGTTVFNLDLWMAGLSANKPLANLLKCICKEYPNHLLLIEGAMGLFDGKKGGGFTSAHLAGYLSFPVLMLLKVDGMGQSCAALAKGFLDYCPPDLDTSPKFLGVLCTHSGSASHEALIRETLKPILEERHIPLLGFLPSKGAPRLPSRHLGLQMPKEMEKALNFDNWLNWFESACDLDLLLERLSAIFPDFPKTRKFEQANSDKQSPASKTQEQPIGFSNSSQKLFSRIVAIARDEAFSFIYSDLPFLLQSLGAKIIYFSPLRDKKLPDCDLVYFPGGYPELYCKSLQDNHDLLKNLDASVQDGVLIYGECGGFIFLGKTLEVEGHTCKMAGLLPVDFAMTDKIQGLGYRQAHFYKDSALRVRGHEFHYVKSLKNDGIPLWQVEREDGYIKKEGLINDRVFGSWLHLYPEGSQDFWEYLITR